MAVSGQREPGDCTYQWVVIAAGREQRHSNLVERFNVRAEDQLSDNLPNAVAPVKQAKSSD